MIPYAYDSLNTNSTHVRANDSDSASSHVRILTLLPGSGNDELCCELRQICLADGDKYEALSYIWGSPERVHQVRCGNDAFIPITLTLREALHTLRDPQRKRSLWIDQLCINQDDVQERNGQVRIMHLVYKCATRTIVFLGGHQQGLVSKVNETTVWRLLLDVFRAHKQAQSSLISQIQRMFEHPWFRRVWILQEISMSDPRKIVVYYGGTILKWSWLAPAATYLGSYEPGKKYRVMEIPISPRRHEMIMSKWTTMNAAASPSTSLSRLRNSSSRYQALLFWDVSLAELLQGSRFCQATDPRDMVYSLLNLLSADRIVQSHAWLLQIDYGLPKHEVYTRAARYCIQTGCSLEIMCYKESSRGDSSLGLPSWVPDWTQQRLFPLHRISIPSHYRSQFHPAIRMTLYTQPDEKSRNHTSVATFDNDKKITLAGYHLGAISRISSAWTTPLDHGDLDTFTEWADIFTGGNAPELTDLPFQPESHRAGLQTAPHSICDFWLRVSRSPRFKTNDTLQPFSSDHPAQYQWRRSAYRRYRTRFRTVAMYRKGFLSFTIFYSWLALMLPYASVGRCVAATKEGFFLLVPPETRPDDVVYFLEGGGTHGYALRRAQDGREVYEFIGAAYVHGFYGIHVDRKGQKSEEITFQ